MAPKNLITNRKLFMIVISVFVFLGITVTYLLSGYLKQIALFNLAQDSAKKTSELVFEVMYAKMEKGWDREEMLTLIQRLNQLKSGMDIRVYRSTKVEELYGTVPGEAEHISNDPFLKRALEGEILFLPEADSGDVRYIYPLTVRQECLACHTNVKVGEVNGVIDMP